MDDGGGMPLDEVLEPFRARMAVTLPDGPARRAGRGAQRRGGSRARRPARVHRRRLPPATGLAAAARAVPRGPARPRDRRQHRERPGLQSLRRHQPAGASAWATTRTTPTATTPASSRRTTSHFPRRGFRERGRVRRELQDLRGPRAVRTLGPLRTPACMGARSDRRARQPPDARRLLAAARGLRARRLPLPRDPGRAATRACGWSRPSTPRWCGPRCAGGRARRAVTLALLGVWHLANSAGYLLEWVGGAPLPEPPGGEAGTVLHVTWSGRIGGIERSLSTLVLTAAERGGRRQRVCFMDGRGPIGDLLVAAGLAVRLGHAGGPVRARSAALAATLRRERPAAVHLHTHSLAVHATGSVARSAGRHARLHRALAARAPAGPEAGRPLPPAAAHDRARRRARGGRGRDHRAPRRGPRSGSPWCRIRSRSRRAPSRRRRRATAASSASSRGWSRRSAWTS